MLKLSRNNQNIKMFGVPPNTLPLVIYIGIFCYWVLLQYMSFKTIAGGFNGAFWRSRKFLTNLPNYLVALTQFVSPVFYISPMVVCVRSFTLKLNLADLCTYPFCPPRLSCLHQACNQWCTQCARQWKGALGGRGLDRSWPTTRTTSAAARRPPAVRRGRCTSPSPWHSTSSMTMTSAI